MIRPATEADVPALVGMARRFHQASPWRDLAPMSVRATVKALVGLMLAADKALFVAERDGEAQGAIGMVLSPVYFADDVTMAQEAFWWCESPRDAVALLRSAIVWAKPRAAVMSMIRLDGLRDEAVDALYRRMGFVPLEHHYALRL